MDTITDITSVNYRMEHLKIYGESLFVAGTTTLTNTKDVEDLMDMSINYVDEKYHSFDHLIPEDRDGSVIVIEAALPFIAADDGITIRSIPFRSSRRTYESTIISFLGSKRLALEWRTAFTTTTPVRASGRVVVPARSKAIVDYVGIRGSCRLPFDYQRSDMYFLNPNILERRKLNCTDGSYHGVSCYNFEFCIRLV